MTLINDRTEKRHTLFFAQKSMATVGEKPNYRVSKYEASCSVWKIPYGIP